MQFPDARILIFAKAPVAGQVKTRLIPSLGAEGAAGLHRRMLERMVSELVGSGLCRVQCCCAPDTEHDVFRQLASQHPIDLQPQVEGDLGARMYQAAGSALSNADRVILVGCDCPELNADYIAQALMQLQAGAEAVVGPAEDGGYVLLGLRQIAMELFTDMPWGGSRVLERTRQRLQGLGWRWAELDTLWDVDRPEDLARLVQASAVSKTNCL